jgi:hypothetical protein
VTDSNLFRIQNHYTDVKRVKDWCDSYEDETPPEVLELDWFRGKFRVVKTYSDEQAVTFSLLFGEIKYADPLDI